MMAHGAMLWGAALYNNGGYPIQGRTIRRELHRGRQAAGACFTVPARHASSRHSRDGLRSIDPLPRWEVSQPGNILRVFERGGKRRLEIGNPDKEEEPGKPDKGLSPRGLGTNNRTDPGLSRPAKDASAGSDAQLSWERTITPAITARRAVRRVTSSTPTTRASRRRAIMPRRAIRDFRSRPTPRFRRTNPAIRSSISSRRRSRPQQCMTCHMHPGTNMVATYLGQMWWDNESDGKMMYPAGQADRPERSPRGRKAR